MDSLQQWNAAVAEARRDGLTAAEAVLRADKANPGLRLKMLEEVNEKRRHGQRR